MNVRKTVVVSGLSATLLIGGAIAGAYLAPKKAAADFDLPGLNQQVQNHEARITNTENDVKVLQSNTSTAPAPSPVPVPVVVAQPVQAPAPAAIQPPPAPSIVSTVYGELQESSLSCSVLITYSDGSVKQDTWQSSAPTGPNTSGGYASPCKRPSGYIIKY